MNINSQIESILFVASKPLSVRTIAKALEVSEDEVNAAVLELKNKFNNDASGIHILVTGDEVQMATNPENTNIIDGFIKSEVGGELTRPQLETLTVVAYRGPVTRPEIEQIRGVNCSIILRNLLMRGLIEEKENELAVLPSYMLSFEALRHLGLSSPSELPEYDVLHAHEHLST